MAPARAKSTNMNSQAKVHVSARSHLGAPPSELDPAALNEERLKRQRERKKASREKRRAQAAALKEQDYSSGPPMPPAVSLPPPENPVRFNLEKSSLKTFTLVRNQNPSDQVASSSNAPDLRRQTFSFVNLVPNSILPSANEGRSSSQQIPLVAPDVTGRRPTSYIVQMVPGNSGLGESSSSNNQQHQPCVFRLTSPIPGKTGSVVGKPSVGNQLFSLTRVQNTDSGGKVVILPPITINPPPASSASSGIALLKQNGKTVGTVGNSSAISSAFANHGKPVNSAARIAPRPSNVSNGSVVINPSYLPVLTRPEVIPLFSTASPDTIWARWVEAYGKSGLSARCSREKERKVLVELETLRCMYDDQQVLSKSPPSPRILEFNDIPPCRIGDLLSLGRFVEVLQHELKLSRTRKRRFNLDFTVAAVTLRSGKVGPFLSILNWLVWAFDERKAYEPRLRIAAEFGVSIQQLPGDHILAYETLRQYLTTLNEHKTSPYDAQFMALLEKLKTTDVSDLTTLERLDLLTTAHESLMQDTDFVSFSVTKLEQEYIQATSRSKQCIQDRMVKMANIDGITIRLKDFDERTKTTRLEDRERSRICDEIKELNKEIDHLNEDQKQADIDAEELQKYVALACHTETLGYDRSFNRYWTFPELSSDLFVESGWICTSAAAPEVCFGPTILSNFVFAARPRDLYYLTEDGKYHKCDSKLISFPYAVHHWSVFTREEIPTLIAALNPIGIREGQLKTKLHALLTAETNQPDRPPPVVADSLLVILQELFLKIAEDLDMNQFLTNSLEHSWRAALVAEDLEGLKQRMVSVFNMILSPLLKKELANPAKGPSWDVALAGTSNMSRIYFLCKTLDASICWDRGLSSAVCKACNKNQRRNKLQRCHGCAAMFHADDCMTFVDKKCSLCLGTANMVTREQAPVSYAEKADSVGSLEREVSVNSSKRKTPGSESGTSTAIHGYKLRRMGNAAVDVDLSSAQVDSNSD